jgi:microcystin-dependent protein
MSQFSKSNLGDIDQETLPIGFIFAVLNSNTPPEGTLVLDGSSLDKTVYADLYSGQDLSLGDRYGNADGSHFYLPDMRGRTVRGRDHGIGRDPGVSSRYGDQASAPTQDNVGSCQNDDLETHTHTYNRPTNRQCDDGSKNGPYAFSSEYATDSEEAGNLETRMKNINVIWVIKY